MINTHRLSLLGCCKIVAFSLFYAASAHIVRPEQHMKKDASSCSWQGPFEGEKISEGTNFYAVESQMSFLQL